MQIASTDHMGKAARLLILYIIGVVLLSSIDITYEWLSPLTNPEVTTPIEWYSFIGLRNGAIWLANREPPGPADGLLLDVHAPAFFPLPFYAGAGPEGGAIVLAVWFIGLIVWITHSLLFAASGRGLRRSSRRI